jgi:hypothetical protein
MIMLNADTVADTDTNAGGYNICIYLLIQK